MFVFIIEKMIREQNEKKKQKLSKKEKIMNEFWNETNLTLKGIAKKYGTSYQYVKNLHNAFIQENNKPVLK